jgi:Zn-dependent M16 (insulinase) family peptidase
MIRHFARATDAMRQTFRERILSATPQQVRQALAEYFRGAAHAGAVAVYSAQEKLEEANRRLDAPLRLEKLGEM